MPNTKIQDPPIELWFGTTRYLPAQLREFTGNFTTDADGRVTVNLTTNGLVGGPALFSSLVKYSAIGFDGSGNALQVPLFYVESASPTQVVFRGIKGRSQGVLLGGTIVPMEFVGAGYTVNVHLVGVKA